MLNGHQSVIVLLLNCAVHKYPIAVTDWNKKYSKNEIYKHINQFAKNENVAIYKSTSNYTNKNVDKDIYVFNKSKATTITPFN
ncbi:hypothetical protein B8A13_13135, partial [Staphylococcus aureus]